MTDGRPVRRAAPSDAEAIAEAHVRGWQTSYRGIVPDAFLDGLDRTRRADAWREQLTAAVEPTPGRGTWVVEAPDGVAGFVDAGPARAEPIAPPDGAGEIFAIYLRPERRDQGYGRALLATALGDLAIARLTPVVLWVLEANAAGRRFYELAGFRVDGTAHTIDIAGAVLPELRYRLDPPPRT
jgi:ribosomal protein S18 acetylase RimI-like enzyme